MPHNGGRMNQFTFIRMHKLHLPASFASKLSFDLCIFKLTACVHSAETQTSDTYSFYLIQSRPVKGSWPLETLQSIWKKKHRLRILD